MFVEGSGLEETALESDIEAIDEALILSWHECAVKRSFLGGSEEDFGAGP